MHRQNPFLTHIVLTLTLLHDSYLKGDQRIDKTTAMHLYQGTSMFKEALSKPIKSSSKDALWTSAALLGAIAFASFEAITPEEAWPLKPDCSSDLDWLKMSDGKKAVYKITDPTRPDSIFTKYSIDHSWMYRPIKSFNSSNLIEFMSFIGHIKSELKALLLQKDAKAMLLIVCWFAKMYKYQWWIQRRGLIEGKAICIYLDCWHGDDMRIQRLLTWPKQQFGLLPPEQMSTRTEIWCPSSTTMLAVM
jgi:hypothetical protein